MSLLFARSGSRLETPSQVLKSWDKLGETAETFLGEVGLSVPSGEKGRSVLEMVWARPTAEFNGISGGYSGKGFKTVIAAEASAKVSFRLVHKQNPDKIRAAFREFVQARVPADCSVQFEKHGGSPAIQPGYDSAFLTKANAALQRAASDAELIYISKKQRASRAPRRPSFAPGSDAKR